jgi:hypothetical protein
VKRSVLPADLTVAEETVARLVYADGITVLSETLMTFGHQELEPP